MTATDTATSVKLHNYFTPKSYDLHVRVDLSNWKYEGTETIVLQQAAHIPPSNLIKLHYSSSMTIQTVTGATILGRDEKAGTLQLQLDGETMNTHTIQFTFSQEIRTEMNGFYRARFKTNDGVEHRMAATHFEPTSARHFYICQDEPAARADFTLHVSLPSSMEGYTVLSNGPLKLKEQHDNTVTHHFDTIPAVPPYLTSCFVGELEYVETTACGIPVKVYTSLGKVQKAAFALKVTAFALEYFEKFFDCKYPLPKLDVVAVPDFPIGGMENWGCIACVESILLEQEKTGVNTLKRVTELICHEVSHNWFGNLVAINWWEGLWLKEGFASWCGYKAAHHFEPSWKCNEDASMEVASALVSDMYENSHPVEVPICDPAEITQIFDAISYDKGMGLVFMLEAFLGEKKWASSVAHYIKKHRYGDTKTIHLWQALEEASGVPLTESMNSFTTQMGYPIIHVNRPSPNLIILRQETSQFVSATTKRNTVWSVPIVLEGANGVTHRVTLIGSEPQQVELPVELANSPWINANPGGKGFFRCRYDEEGFSSLLNVYSSLSIPDRRALIADTVASIYMGYEDVERLAIFRSLLSEHESDRSIWQEYRNSMENFIGFLEDEGLHKELNFNLMYTIGEMATKLLNENPSTAEERMRRAFFINAAISTALKCLPTKDACKVPSVEWALKQASAFLKGAEYSADTITMSLSSYVRLGPDDAASRTDALWKHYTNIHDNDEVCRSILSALCWAEDPEFVESILKRCIYDNGIRSQYGGILFASLSSNPSLPRGHVWSMFKRHFDGVDRQWGGGTFRIQNIVEHVGSTLVGEEQARDFETFFHEHPLPHARLAVRRAVEGIRLRSWMLSKWGGGPKLSYIFFPR
ncbi:aminopeptidase [Trypanosoma theileri]|uniref:Aminopeptidase n=1 Tax=Trypanosoma theileri TaxID=67003 RepID=A0A1X0P9F6_9TRYP|nr:aminopeptidase [Trypanosoma theileri]ORC93465.1 aminopeptidase [Trypanosoma theileri]